MNEPILKEPMFADERQREGLRGQPGGLLRPHDPTPRPFAARSLADLLRIALARPG